MEVTLQPMGLQVSRFASSDYLWVLRIDSDWSDPVAHGFAGASIRVFWLSAGASTHAGEHFVLFGHLVGPTLRSHRCKPLTKVIVFPIIAMHLLGLRLFCTFGPRCEPHTYFCRRLRLVIGDTFTRCLSAGITQRRTSISADLQKKSCEIVGFGFGQRRPCRPWVCKRLCLRFTSGRTPTSADTKTLGNI